MKVILAFTAACILAAPAFANDRHGYYRPDGTWVPQQPPQVRQDRDYREGYRDGYRRGVNEGYNTSNSNNSSTQPGAIKSTPTVTPPARAVFPEKK